MQLFLESARLAERSERKNAGGDGAAVSVLSGLRFLRKHLGLQIGVDFIVNAQVTSGLSRSRRRF